MEWGYPALMFAEHEHVAIAGHDELGATGRSGGERLDGRPPPPAVLRRRSAVSLRPARVARDAEFSDGVSLELLSVIRSCERPDGDQRYRTEKSSRPPH